MFRHNWLSAAIAVLILVSTTACDDQQASVETTSPTPTQAETVAKQADTPAPRETSMPAETAPAATPATGSVEVSAAEGEPADSNIAIIETSMGTIKVELYADRAPITVANFKKLVEQEFYDGTIFHRVVKDFMNQGGGFNDDYTNKGARADLEPIKLEIHPELKHTAGAIAMARTGDPNSATCQFYLCPQPTPFLDGQYAVFGQVIEGLDVVKAINSVETRYGQLEQQTRSGQLTMSRTQRPSVPAETIYINSIRLGSES